MAFSRSDLRAAVRRALNDAEVAFWSDVEIDTYVYRAYQDLARQSRGVWDLTYAENLPAGFSYTQPWEAAYADFDYGVANYTYDDERLLLGDEGAMLGPAQHTSPADLAFLADVEASTAIPATAQLPTTVTEMDRPTWDNMAIPVVMPAQAQRIDPRYELTIGEVYALVATQQRVRTIRKVRVPAASADTYTIHDTWGVCRSIADVSADTTVTGTWGIPRRIPGHQPMGPERFGTPRRFYQDGKNVRVEHWRYGRSLDAGAWELPDRSARYARDYALARCYERRGPAQDLLLAKHYDARYLRGLARLVRRVQLVGRQRVGQFGGPSVRRAGPPRPRMPWNYGSTMRQ